MVLLFHDFVTAFRHVRDDFADDCRDSKPIWNTRRFISTVDFFEFITTLVVLTSALLTLSFILYSLPLPFSSQAGMTSPSSYVLTMAPAFVIFTSDALSIIVASVPVNVGTGLSPGARVGLFERSPTAWVSLSSALSRPRVVAASDRTLSLGLTDVDVLSTISLAGQKFAAIHQSDAIR